MGSNSSWDYFYSCPYCGDRVENLDKFCLHCHSHITPFKSLHNKDYYVNKSNEKYGKLNKWKEFVLEEVRENPLFDEEKYNLPKNETQNNYSAQYFQKTMNNKQRNLPKCPTCGSTNISKISGVKRAVHGYAFGLFSKTARLQFECKNCGYKW